MQDKNSEEFLLKESKVSSKIKGLKTTNNNITTNDLSPLLNTPTLLSLSKDMLDSKYDMQNVPTTSKMFNNSVAEKSITSMKNKRNSKHVISDKLFLKRKKIDNAKSLKTPNTKQELNSNQEFLSPMPPPPPPIAAVRPETRHHLIDLHGLALFLRSNTRCMQCYGLNCLHVMGTIGRQMPPTVSSITIKCRNCNLVLNQNLTPPPATIQTAKYETSLHVSEDDSESIISSQGMKSSYNTEAVWIKEEAKLDASTETRSHIDPLTVSSDSVGCNTAIQITEGTFTNDLDKLNPLLKKNDLPFPKIEDPVLDFKTEIQRLCRKTDYHNETTSHDTKSIFRDTNNLTNENNLSTLTLLLLKILHNPNIQENVICRKDIMQQLGKFIQCICKDCDSTLCTEIKKEHVNSKITCKQEIPFFPDNNSDRQFVGKLKDFVSKPFVTNSTFQKFIYPEMQKLILKNQLESAKMPANNNAKHSKNKDVPVNNSIKQETTNDEQIF